MARYANRRGTAAAWSTANPVLAQGEIGLIVDAVPTGTVTAMKIGDGVTAWNLLPEFSSGDDGPGVVVVNDLATADPTAALSAAMGVQLESEKADADAVATAMIGKVSTTRTVNGLALSGDIVLTKTHIGLPLVDNTSDNSKPISVLQQAALDGKAPLLPAYTFSTALTLTGAAHGNRHGSFTGAGPVTIPLGAGLVGDMIEFTHDGTGVVTVSGTAALAATVKGTVDPHETFGAVLSATGWNVFSPPSNSGGGGGGGLSAIPWLGLEGGNAQGNLEPIYGGSASTVHGSTVGFYGGNAATNFS